MSPIKKLRPNTLAAIDRDAAKVVAKMWSDFCRSRAFLTRIASGQYTRQQHRLKKMRLESDWSDDDVARVLARAEAFERYVTPQMRRALGVKKAGRS